MRTLSTRCTREDILKEQEILKQEPDMLDDVENWCYHIYAKKESRYRKTNNVSETAVFQTKVRCVETGVVYANVLQVEKITGLEPCRIIESCRNGKRYKYKKEKGCRTVWGYHWEFVDTEEDEK